MTYTGKYDSTDKELSIDEQLQQEMQLEVDNALEYLKRYTYNIDTLLSKKYSKEVKKAMINYLVEQL